MLQQLSQYPMVKKPAVKCLRLLASIKRYRTVVRRGIRYRLDLHEVIDRSIYALGGWEISVCSFLRRHIHSGDIIVEVGANVGAHTLLMAKLAGPTGHVYAFEPAAYALDKLRANLALNPGLRNVTVTPSLVSNHEKQTPNRRLKASWPVDGDQLVREPVNGEPVTIDDFVAAQRLNSLSLLKIDVDGYDYKVLQGATLALGRFRPFVLIELSDETLQQQGDSVAVIHELLDGLGYRLHSQLGENAVFSPTRDQQVKEGC